MYLFTLLLLRSLFFRAASLTEKQELIEILRSDGLRKIVFFFSSRKAENIISYLKNGFEIGFGLGFIC